MEIPRGESGALRVLPVSVLGIGAAPGMIIHIAIFRRGFSFQFYEQDFFDPIGPSTTYLRFGWIRRGKITRSWLLRSSEYGGLEMRYQTADGRSRGWRLRGPIEHIGPSF